MKLAGDFKENNLDFLRLIFAGIVVGFHTGILTGIASLAFLARYCSPHFAVRGFFVISGLLIYRSYTRSSSVRSYFDKRLRRIYPAYAAVVLTAAAVLPLLSPVFPWRTYGIAFWKYLGANLLFLNFLAPNLPGVFAGNSLQAVDGALWTIKIEVAFYLCVPAIYYFARKFGTAKVVGLLFGLSCLWKYAFWQIAVLHPAHQIWHKLDVQIPAQMMYFCAGILLFLYFDKLRQQVLPVSVIAVAALIADHIWRRQVFDVLWICGFVLVCGFVRYLGNFSKYGDFSYGVYIVHWPILQCMIWFKLTKMAPAAFLALEIVLVFSGSLLMWHLVEKRFLASGSHYKRSASTVEAKVRTPANAG